MKSVFYDLNVCDKNAENNFNLRHGILMENAAYGMAIKIRKILEEQFDKTSIVVQIICGSGDNGGDGLALARLLWDYCNLTVVLVKEPKSELCKLQAERLQLLEVPIQKTIINKCDLLVDCFLGTGLKGNLSENAKSIIQQMIEVKAKLKIACDIPSGLSQDGVPSPIAVKSDFTFSMGALKQSLYSDLSKDVVGQIFVLPLGLPSQKYELKTNLFALEKKDMQLPTRLMHNSNKGSFGHALIHCGEKEGACFLAGTAALKFGAGLLTIIGLKPQNIPFDFMHSKNVIDNFNAIAIGSGLGKYADEVVVDLLPNTAIQNAKVVFDADILKMPALINYLPKFKTCILTPHPKEFQCILKNAGIGNYSVQEIQKRRFELANAFSKKYPQVVLLLKGANTLIASNETIYINAHGSNKLSKAGTGDVLTGMILALLAQGYTTLQASITASLAHSFASHFTEGSYFLTASELIQNLGKLER